MGRALIICFFQKQLTSLSYISRIRISDWNFFIKTDVINLKFDDHEWKRKKGNID